MNSKTISILAVSIAVIAAAAAAIVVSVSRSKAANAYAEAEASAADCAKAEERRVSKEAEIEAAKRRTAEANENARTNELVAAKLARETAEIEAKAAADKKETAVANAAAEREKADAARAAREDARNKAEQAKYEASKAKDQAAAEASKAETEANRRAAEQLKTDRAAAETKAMELRKIDFESMEHDLLEWQQDLEERERAIRPEKTISELSWAGGMEDAIIDAEGNVRKQVKEEYDPEKDMSLPGASRKLAKAQRIVREKHDARAEKTRDAIIASMEKLYVSALKDGRVIDADYYKKSILSMYPDWKFKGE